MSEAATAPTRCPVRRRSQSMAWRSIRRKHQAARLEGEIEQRARPLAPELFDQPDGALAQARNDLAAIPARGAPADPAAFEQHDLQPALGRMQRGGQAGAAAADHDEVGLDFAEQRRMARRRVGRRDIVGLLDIQAGVERHGHTLSSRWSRSHDVTTLWKESSSTSFIRMKVVKNGSPSSDRTGWQAARRCSASSMVRGKVLGRR